MSTPLKILAAEADSALAQAKKLREEMNSFPATDPRRKTHEERIRALLELSRRLANAVMTSASTSS